ncbi:MAG: phage major capsid protein [Rickettsiaceae bacterium]|nr:phage major capsid protein [Rickettsiaceae bacterium]
MNIENIDRKIDKMADEWKDFVNNKHLSKMKDLETKMFQIQSTLAGVGSLIVSDDDEYGNFANYIRSGETDMLETKSLSSAQDEGGYLLTPALYNKIVSAITAKSPMRQIASVETISTNALDVIIEDGNFDCGWVLDGEERVSTGTSKLKQKRIVVHELYAQPKATQRLLDDAAINVEQWLNERLEDSFVKAENKSFISGDGINQPYGILSNDTISSVKSEESDSISIDDILDLMNSLDEVFLSNATFLMNRTTLSEIQKIRDDNGRFIWQPAIAESRPDTLFGIPVVCSSEMPPLAAGAKAIALGDFKSAYKIVDRSGVAVMRDPYTEKPFVKFYAVKRVGGDVVNSSAIKFLKIAEEKVE